MQVSSYSSTTHGSSRSLRSRMRIGGTYLLLLVVAVFFVAPFLWLFITALKAPWELNAFPVRFWPAQPLWENFVQAFTSINFLAYTANSLTLTTLYSVPVPLSSALVGFGFARFKGKGKRPLFILMLSILMLLPSESERRIL